MKKKNNGDKRLLTAIVKAFELPQEVILNKPLITLTGRECLIIENYITLTEYTVDSVKINTPSGILKIEGRSIRITEITADAVTLEGSFIKTEYEV